METNVCRYCHKVFRSNLRLYTCDECMEADNKRFETIEEYLRSYPNSNAMQIAEALGINAMDVLHYVDEGRLMVSKGRFEQIDNK